MNGLVLSVWQRVLFGVVIAVGMTVVQYLAPGGGQLYPAIVTGIGSGLFLAVAVGRADLSTPLRPLTVLRALMMAAGLAVLGFGIATLDGGLSASGLVIAATGGVPLLVDARKRRRGTG